ncbi:MAG TPA: DUF3617 domain-containing protein [Allosphingosinicella sp.]|jgi:hypothetical protein|nr:DUF3617 domain-containing protein [Allosphingosinicella sp.]
MKRLIILAPAIALVTIAGCSRGADQLQPGQWEKTLRFKSLELTGASPEVQARANRQVGQSQTNQECITPEKARNPLQEMREMAAQGRAANCRFTDETFSGGVIRIRATCGGAGQNESGTLSVEGSFTETTLQATLTVSGQGVASPMMPGVTGMRMTAEISGRRTGDCAAGAARPGNGL